MRYVYVEDVIGTTNGLSGCRGCGGFGQSGSYSAAVKKLQLNLRALAAKTGNEDYHPGPADGLYGRNTHAALIRTSRDFLEPTGLCTSTCRSTCNTLWLRAKGACKDCIATMLRGMNALWSGVGQEPVVLHGFRAIGPMDTPSPDAVTIPYSPFSEVEIAEIADRYGAFLDAYVARYGDGGQLDPAQIARREDVSMEEAERLAAERRAQQGGGQASEQPSPTTVQPPPPTVVKKAGFPWWWLLLFAGVGGAAWYAWKHGEGARTSPEDVTEYSGFGRRKLLPPMGGGCGCGG